MSELFNLFKLWLEKRREKKARRKMEKQWRPIDSDGLKVTLLEVMVWFNERSIRIWTCPTCGRWNDPFEVKNLPKTWDMRTAVAARLDVGVCKNCLKECSLDFNYYHKRWDVGVRYSGEEPSLLGKTIYWNVLATPPISEGISDSPKTREKKEVVIDVRRVVKL